MGCAGSSIAKADGGNKKVKKPKPWKHSQPITRAQLVMMRDEFWDTAPHYGGRKACSVEIALDKRIIFQNATVVCLSEIWDALRAAAEAEVALAQAIVDSAGVIVQSEDMTICYDERGAKYELPKYVLSEPSNLISDN
ncbi:Ubiquitin domain-containing protein 1 [Linum perenne]